jgi:hypothetical protein
VKKCHMLRTLQMGNLGELKRRTIAVVESSYSDAEMCVGEHLSARQGAHMETY